MSNWVRPNFNLANTIKPRRTYIQWAAFADSEGAVTHDVRKSEVLRRLVVLTPEAVRESEVVVDHPDTRKTMSQLLCFISFPSYFFNLIYSLLLFYHISIFVLLHISSIDL